MTREIVLAGTRVADDTDAFVVAEIGSNHQGSVEMAHRMIDAAAAAGANAVKLQKRDNLSLYTRALYDAPYHSENAFGLTYGAHREALELAWDDYGRLQEHAHRLSMAFFATPFDMPSVDFLAKLGMPMLKIASGDLRSLPLIRYAAQVGVPLIMSTGGGTMQDVDRVWNVLTPEQQGRLILLQCTASYPCDPGEMNLMVIQTYRESYSCVVGLSDHQAGISMGPPAYVLGARVFEKHFTLSRTMRGTDHAFSLEPEGLRRFVRDLRRTRQALGDGVKRPYPSEQASLWKMGKSLVAERDLLPGHLLVEEDLGLRSPDGGLAPWKLDKLLGRELLEPLAAGDILTSSGIVR